MMQSPHTSRQSSNTALLLAAIDHLQALYLANPDRCLSVMINRYYHLLLSESLDPSERNKWLNQQQIWSRSSQVGGTRNQPDLLIL
jgi:hypothetical protein